MNIRNLKNDKERIAFLEDYRNMDNGWDLWKFDDDLQRRMWMIRLSGGVIFVVEEQLRTFSYPEKHESWSVMHWYIIEDPTAIFGDCVASKSMALAKLKEVSKNGQYKTDKRASKKE